MQSLPKYSIITNHFAQLFCRQFTRFGDECQLPLGLNWVFKMFNSCSNMIEVFQNYRIALSMTRKGIRRVRGIPPDTHCYIIPLLCKCLPVFDEICRCSANFMHSCMVHNTNVVRSVANYGILFGRCESPVGRNVLYSMHRFNAVLYDILSEEFDALVWKHATLLRTSLMSRNSLSAC